MNASRRAAALTAAALLTATLAGCSTDSGAPTAASSPDGEPQSLGHVHGIGTDPADGTVYIASHFGVFRLDEDSGPERVADRWQDTMAFTVVGPGHFLASGHPDLREDLPAHLGLIESTDAAQTWTPLSLQGEADFHALEVAGQRTYGYDSVGGQLLVSEDRRTWRRLDQTAVLDLAADPDEHDRLLATTGQGRLVEYQVGTRAAPSALDAPRLAFIDWADADTLVGLAPDGVIYVSGDGAQSWQRTTAVPGDAQALEVSAQRWYAATSRGVYASTDAGRSWEPLVAHSGEGHPG